MTRWGPRWIHRHQGQVLRSCHLIPTFTDSSKLLLGTTAIREQAGHLKDAAHVCGLPKQACHTF
jgi:hypothetical protein